MANTTQGAVALERDRTGDVMVTWVYPTLSPELRRILEKKCGLKGDDCPKEAQTSFGRYGKVWYYINTVILPDISQPGLENVEAFAIVVLAEDFFPEKYLQLASVLSAQFGASGNGPKILTSLMSVTLRGGCKAGGDVFALAEYKDVRKAYMEPSLKDVISRFGVETILIYIAVLLKKRIAVVCPDVEKLLNVVRTIPQFVLSRMDWDILYPNVELNDVELADMTSAGSHYVAGFTDSSISIREDLYDLLVDVSGASITIASHASEAFGLGKVHKEIAMFMVGAVDDESITQPKLLKELVNRTTMLTDGLQKLASPSAADETKMVVTMEVIKARKMAKTMHTFLYNLAVAEDMIE